MTHTCDGTLAGCFGCAAIARRLADVRAMMTHDDRLHDVARARIWAKVDDAIALRASHRRIGWRWPVALASAAAVAAAIALVARARGTADATERVLSAPPDVTVTASIGPHARAAIVGPAQLAVTSSIGEMTTVRLDLGTFYAQFDGGPGRALRVVAPGAIVDVVGTLFAIETNARASCISVAHGRVRVTMGSRVADVAGGERLCTGDAAPAPIEPRIRDALARHELVLAAREPSAPTTSPATTGTATSPSTTNPPTPAPTTSSATTSPSPTRIVSATHGTAPSPSAMNRSPTSGTATNPSTTNPTAPPSPTASTSSSATNGTPSRSTTDQPTMPPTTNGTTIPSTTNRPTTNGTTIPSATPPTTTEANGPPPAAVTASSTSQRREPTASAPPPPPPPPTAAELYREAEAALARRDVAAADRVLAKLLADDPRSPLADQALYERARIAYQRHAWGEARRHLDLLANVGATPLAEPGRYLTCRIEVEAHDADAARCLADYRVAYPRSAHDLDVLGLLVHLAHADAGCAGARKLVDELVKSYPASALARGWRARCPEAK